MSFHHAMDEERHYITHQSPNAKFTGSHKLLCLACNKLVDQDKWLEHVAIKTHTDLKFRCYFCRRGFTEERNMECHKVILCLASSLQQLKVLQNH